MSAPGSSPAAGIGSAPSRIRTAPTSAALGHGVRDLCQAHVDGVARAAGGEAPPGPAGTRRRSRQRHPRGRCPGGWRVRMPSRRSMALGPRKSARTAACEPVGAPWHGSLDRLQPVVAREEHLDLRGRCRGAGGEAQRHGGDRAQDQEPGVPLERERHTMNLHEQDRIPAREPRPARWSVDHAVDPRGDLVDVAAQVVALDHLAEEADREQLHADHDEQHAELQERPVADGVAQRS